MEKIGNGFVAELSRVACRMIENKAREIKENEADLWEGFREEMRIVRNSAENAAENIGVEFAFNSSFARHY